jgi:hypothetical protein
MVDEHDDEQPSFEVTNPNAPYYIRTSLGKEQIESVEIDDSESTTEAGSIFSQVNCLPTIEQGSSQFPPDRPKEPLNLHAIAPGNVLSIHLRCLTRFLARHASLMLPKRLSRLHLLTSTSRSAPRRPFSASIRHLRSGPAQLHKALLSQSGRAGRGARHKIQVYDAHVFKVGQ